MIAGLIPSNCCRVTPFSVSTPISNPLLENCRKKIDRFGGVSGSLWCNQIREKGYHDAHSTQTSSWRCFVHNRRTVYARKRPFADLPGTYHSAPGPVPGGRRSGF